MVQLIHSCHKPNTLYSQISNVLSVPSAIHIIDSGWESLLSLKYMYIHYYTYCFDCALNALFFGRLAYGLIK